MYEHGAKALLKMVEKKGDNYCLRFASIGNFSRESLPILHNYYVLRDIRNKFKEEKAFLEKSLSGISEKDKETLVNAILYRRTATPVLLARRNGIDLSVDQVTCLIEERYLTYETLVLAKTSQLTTFFFQHILKRTLTGVFVKLTFQLNQFFL